MKTRKYLAFAMYAAFMGFTTETRAIGMAYLALAFFSCGRIRILQLAYSEGR